MIRKDYKLSIRNHRLLDDKSSKELLMIIDKPREQGRVVRHITVSGLTNGFNDVNNISMIDFAVYGTSDEDIKKIIQDIINEINDLNPKLKPEF